MGNRNLKSRHIEVEKIFKEQVTYPCDVKVHTFKLALKFRSVKQIKSNLLRVSCLSTVHAEIQKTGEVNQIENEENVLVTNLKIEGPLPNLFSVGERILKNEQLRCAFIEVTTFEPIFGKDNEIEIWREDQNVQIQILPSIKDVIDFSAEKKREKTKNQMEKLGKMNYKSISDVQESNSPLRVEGNKKQYLLNSSPNKIKEDNNASVKSYETEELKQESENDQLIKHHETESSGGKDRSTIEIKFSYSIPSEEFLGRCFYFDFYNKQKYFRLFAPVTVLFRMFYASSNKKTLSLTTITLGAIDHLTEIVEKQSEQMKEIREELKEIKSEQMRDIREELKEMKRREEEREKVNQEMKKQTNLILELLQKMQKPSKE